MKTYNEKTYAIELISELHNTSNIMEIKKIAKEVLDIKLTLHEIIDYLALTDDSEKISNLIENNNNLNENKYEWEESRMS